MDWLLWSAVSWFWNSPAVGRTTVQFIDTFAHLTQRPFLDSRPGGNNCTFWGGKSADQNRPPICRPPRTELPKGRVNWQLGTMSKNGWLRKFAFYKRCNEKNNQVFPAEYSPLLWTCRWMLCTPRRTPVVLSRLVSCVVPILFLKTLRNFRNNFSIFCL